MTETLPIPEVPGYPIVGNIFSINPDFPLGSLKSFAEEHGEIYRLRFPGRSSVVVSTQELVNDACDERRFRKSVSSALKEVRKGVHDGLFTAVDGEENWGIAHRVLMPAFGPISIHGMFDEMHEVASQLALKWARFGPESYIMVSDDFTRLTLDTLALCSMGYRFNSYYSEDMHPFIEAMGDFLTESGSKMRRPPIPSYFFRAKDEKFGADIDVLRSTARGVLESRKLHDSGRKDLLDAMLKGKDGRTGKKMTDDSIMDNLITFLIAGHETTSGLLSFTFYQLLKHPEIYRKAQQEIDQVVGKGTITVDHLSKLPYLNGLLRESLRLNATIPVIIVEPIEDTILAGKYAVKKGEPVLLLLAQMHLDPKVHGDDALEFKPERMMDKAFNKMSQDFPNSWKPFGNGMRGCIGRPFAWQESLLVMAILLQNFNFEAEPNYELAIKQTLTIKPKNFRMRAILREGLDATLLQHRLTGSGSLSNGVANKKSESGNESGDDDDGAPMTILYGSNSGTCEALAQRVATDAASHGFRAEKVDTLDNAKGKVPRNQPVVIITPSYEGEPPDNAAQFVSWIQDAKDGALNDVSYAVFGCGHKDWVQTYHRIPRLVDERLEKLGAKRVAEIGLADASRGDLFTDFETWEDNVLWPSLSGKFEVSDKDRADAQARRTLDVAISSPRVSALRQEVKEAVVVDSRALTTDGTKRHLEIKLPEGMTYSAGDYLAVLPINPWETIHRATRRFRLARDAHLEISNQGSPIHLPTKTSVPAVEVLGSYVELSQPATKRNISSLVYYASSQETQSKLNKLAADDYADEISAKRVSVLDLLERYPDIDMPIGVFLPMLPPMRVRQYSISSSPLWNSSHVTLTFSVLNEASLSGQGPYLGVATSFLSSLLEKDTIHVSVRPSHPAFSLPTSPSDTPMICVAAGSGLAPFRGFIQHRASMIASGQKLAPAILFFGCHSPECDDLYRDELDKWEADGAVEVYRAYSRGGKTVTRQHVDDVMWEKRAQIIDLWEKSAKMYVCGARGVAESVKEAIIKIRLDEDGDDADEEKTREWFEGLRNVRYVMDVFD